MTGQHHARNLHQPGVGPFLMCSCGRYEGDPETPLRVQRIELRDHRKEEQACT